MSETKEKITFIATGGTIDSKFHGASERKIVKTESGIPEYLDDVINPHFYFDHKKAVMIDSVDMIDEHRVKIVAAINESENEKIVITHGTDTMINTANYIEKHIPNLNKTIVLVGSILPLDGFYHSDAPFNLGYAIAQVQSRPHGVYLCMNATCFTTQEVYKNTRIGRFEYKDAV